MTRQRIRRSGRPGSPTAPSQPVCRRRGRAGGTPVAGGRAGWPARHARGSSRRGGTTGRGQYAVIGPPPDGESPADRAVPLFPDPGPDRPDPDHPPTRRARKGSGREGAHRPVRTESTRLAGHDRPLDPGLPPRRIRRAGPRAAQGRPTDPDGGARAGSPRSPPPASPTAPAASDRDRHPHTPVSRRPGPTPTIAPKPSTAAPASASTSMWCDATPGEIPLGSSSSLARQPILTRSPTSDTAGSTTSRPDLSLASY
jgi:hypothetical protein